MKISTLEKINNNRTIILDKSKEYIVNDNKDLFENFNKVLDDSLNYDKDSKEYKSILQAKEIIFQLTQEIANSKSVDDIVKLRNKINYYINKIKKELVKRNINYEEMEEIQEKVASLRTSISIYLRSLKRASILKEINNLYDDINNLSIEDCNRLKKLLSNERRYNKRVLDNFNNKEMLVKPEVMVEDDTINDVTLIIEEDINLNEETIYHTINIDDKIECIIHFDSDESFTIFSHVSSNNVSNEGDLNDRVLYYKKYYNLSDVSSYDATVFKNIIKLIKNIHRYRINNKLIKKAINDYNMFYHGCDLGGFIEYSKKKNSIFTALSIIFKKSRLSQREVEYLSNYDKCTDWIREFYPIDEYENKRLIRVK